MYLLDTNVVSETRRRSPDPDLVEWLEAAPDHGLYLSVLVIGEIRQGIERLRRRDRTQAAALDEWLSGLVDHYADRIVPITAEVAHRWGELNVPDPLPVVDCLQAATAMVHGWTFVTRTTQDVERTGVQLLNPFGRQS